MMQNFIPLSNGYKIPPIGFGCGAVKPEDAYRVLTTALDSGYRLFDCALLYQNESAIGDVLEKIFSQGKYRREEVFITTKLPMIGNHPERVEHFIKQSLRNLKLSYIDLYLIHFPVGFVYTKDDEYFPKKDGILQLDFETNIVEIWRSMEAQVDAKRTRSIGLSNFNQEQILRILQFSRIPPVNLQIELHAYFQQKGFQSFCNFHEIVVSAYGPLGSPGRRAEFRPDGVPDILNDPIVRKLAEKYRKSVSQILLRFLMQEGIVALPKSSTKERIRGNIDIFDFFLSEDDVAEMRFLDKGENGRSFDYTKIFPGLKSHPENPITDICNCADGCKLCYDLY